MKTFLAVFLISAFCSLPCLNAATYYVSPSGNDANPCATAQTILTPKKTIASAASCLAAGDTLVLRDGTYPSALSALPNGSAGTYITIKAENDGEVLLAGLSMDHTDSYLQFQGLRFQGNGVKVILGNHLKFQRCEFKGGPALDNNASGSIGTNDFNDTSDILIEDCWFHGLGGRYNLIVYNANRVVIRRVVIRHDGGWTDTKGDPEAGLNFYNSSNCSAQNVIAIDSNLTYHTWQSALYNVYNTASPNSSNNNSWLGVIALNNFSASDGAGLRFDGNGTQSGHVIQDAVLWDANAGLNLAYQGSVSVTATRLTIGRNSGSSVGIGSGSGGSKSISNVRFFGATTSGISASNTATGKPTYLTQQFGGIGATIVNAIGATGTLQGESGWNTDTGVVLWPFPNEARIKKEMCADTGITRGFCSDSSLTHYIMNYLGNGDPYSGSIPPPPPPPSGSDCDLNSDVASNVTDVQLAVNQAIGVAACSTADINKDTLCNVVDVQRVVNAALGGICVTP